MASNRDRRSELSPTWVRLVCCVGCLMLGFLASFLGGAFQRHAWVDDTAKPALWPPQWVFPLAWVGNYTLMGLALAELWRRRQHRSARRALGLFTLNFCHNLAFIPIVYRAKSRRIYVLMDSVATILTLATTSASAGVARQTAWLLAPYVAWSCFTTAIKVAWWRMERHAER